MEEWLAIHPGGQHLFAKSNGKPLEDRTARDAFGAVTDNSRWKVLRGYHVLRHSFASNLARHGVDDRVIRKLLGHESDEMTERYRHLFPEDKEAAVNLPNNGYINRLPESLVVEVPAIVDKNGVTGVKLGDIPPGFLGLLQNQVAIHDLTAETVLTGSRQIALQALLADPNVDKVEAAERTLDTMLELQSEYLGYIK